MTPRKQQPTKVQAVFFGVLALMLLASRVLSLFEGHSPTVPFWIIVGLNLVLLGLCIWWYVRAAKVPKNTRRGSKDFF
ncbi:hypothetical protein DM793_21705 [Paenarthrobacter nitroguajacolicus]|nr:hypothetical protein [Paenarthrobacter nitroguajacolicus]